MTPGEKSNAIVLDLLELITSSGARQPTDAAPAPTELIAPAPVAAAAADAAPDPASDTAATAPHDMSGLEVTDFSDTITGEVFDELFRR